MLLRRHRGEAEFRERFGDAYDGFQLTNCNRNGRSFVCINLCLVDLSADAFSLPLLGPPLLMSQPPPPAYLTLRQRSFLVTLLEIGDTRSAVADISFYFLHWNFAHITRLYGRLAHVNIHDMSCNGFVARWVMIILTMKIMSNLDRTVVWKSMLSPGDFISSYRPKIDVREFNMVVIPAFAIEIVCCSIALLGLHPSFYRTRLCTPHH